jgi:hypothetical protein
MRRRDDDVEVIPRTETPEGKIRVPRKDSEGDVKHISEHFEDKPARRFSRRQRATKSKRSRRH